jgi:hypothetical protein
MAQTTVQTAKSVHIPDGCKIEVGETLAALVNIGALKGDASAEFTWDAVEIAFNNVDKIESIRNPAINASFEIAELNPDNIATLSGGLITVTNTAGTEVTGATQTIAAGYTYGKFIKLENQMGDGTACTITAVTQATATALVKDTDYFEIFNENGVFGIYIIDTATSDNTKATVVTYNYTPNASKTMKAGASSVTINPKIVRFINTDSAGKKRQLTIWSAAIQPSINFSFRAMDSDGVETIPISLKGSLDSTQAAGSQLFEFVDEQVV